MVGALVGGTLEQGIEQEEEWKELGSHWMRNLAVLGASKVWIKEMSCGHLFQNGPKNGRKNGKEAIVYL